MNSTADNVNKQSERKDFLLIQAEYSSLVNRLETNSIDSLNYAVYIASFILRLLARDLGSEAISMAECVLAVNIEDISKVKVTLNFLESQILSFDGLSDYADNEESKALIAEDLRRLTLIRDKLKEFLDSEEG